MKKYILDTSALIVDPQTWKSFKNAEVIIPIAVLNELDKLKKQPGEVGKSARVCIRLLDDISNNGDINTGIKLEDEIILKIDATYNNMSDPAYQGFGDPTYGDTQILACLYTHYLLAKQDVTLVSNDINLRIKAKSRGIEAISHVREGKVSSDLYSGCQVIHNEEAGIELVTTGRLSVEGYNLKLYPNECVLFQGDDGENIIMGRKVSDNEIRTLKKCYPWELSSRNKEQAFAIELLMDTNIDLVTLTGSAGSGKSLVAIASALELVLNKKKYDKLIIYRPIQSVGAEIGYTPGTIEEKLAPWFQPIMDSFEVLFNNKYDWKKDLEMYQKKGRIEFGAITYIRGRSIPNAIILLDEAQNLNKEEIKTILTRAGEGTKVILTGDLDQIDNNSLDAINNGLTYCIEKFKDSPLAGHITFTQGERSRLATEAANIL